MSTRTHASKTVSPATATASTEVAAHAHAHAHAPAGATAPATAPGGATPAAPSAATAPAAHAPPVAFIASPPASASIPSVPDGFEPTTGTNYRGVQPRKAELVALPLAIRDLGNFKSYGAVIGATAPPLDEVQQIFTVTGEWSTMRNASTAWDAYARDQEGIAWTVMRTMMDRLKPAFLLAARTNPSIATTYAGLAALLGAKSVSAKKAVATKKKNKQDVAQGKTPTAGQVGKKRGKAAAKAALAELAAQNAKLTPPPPNHPAPVPVVAPVAVPAPALPAPAAQVAIAPAAAANGGPPGNGAAHS